tara:strand:+ start:1129 stop:1323 length:195 start_codon:yes stop_codon:yes gene_type:complete
MDLAWGGVKQIRTPNDMGDSIQVIINDNGKLICGKPVGATYHIVADIEGQVLAHLANEPIAELD